MGVETYRAVFKASGHGDVVSAFDKMGAAASRASAAVKAFHVAAVSVAAATGAITGIGIAAVKVAADFQTLQAKLDAVMGSAAKGKEAFSWATQFAQETPFTLREVVQLMTQMSAMQLNPFRDLRRIGDAALGDFERAQRIVTALGQMKTKGFVSGEELMQLQENAIPATRIIQEAFGLTAKQVANIGNLRLPSDSAIAAILKFTDSRFTGAMLRQMDTIQGKISNLSDAKDKFLNAIGTALAPAVTDVLEKLSAWFSDQKNIERAVRIFSYMRSAAESVGIVLQRVMKSLFDGEPGIPRWLAQIGHFMVTMLQLAAVYRATMLGFDLGKALGSLSANPAIRTLAGLAGALGGLALGAVGSAMFGTLHNKIAGVTQKNTPTLPDLVKGIDVSGRADAITKATLAKLPKNGADEAKLSKAADAAAASAPVAAAVSAASKLMQQAIIGARGPLGQHGFRPMDLGVKVAPHVNPKIVVQLNNPGKGIEKAFNEAAANAFQDGMVKILSNPKDAAAMAQVLRPYLGLA